MHRSERNMELSVGDRVSAAMDRWWPVFIIAFGIVFVLGIPS